MKKGDHCNFSFIIYKDERNNLLSKKQKCDTRQSKNKL